MIFVTRYFSKECKGREIHKIMVMSKINVLQYFVTIGRQCLKEHGVLVVLWMQLHGWVMIELCPDRAGQIRSGLV